MGTAAELVGPADPIGSGGVRMGQVIEGVDLAADLDAAKFRRIEDAFNASGVLVFRGQQLTPEKQIAFSRRFGELAIHVVDTHLLGGHPEIFKISNILENGKRVGASAEYWHSDLTYLAEPARCSLLYAIEIPVDNAGNALGDTCFASTEAAYAALGDAMKERLQGLKAVHRFGDAYKRQQVRREAAGDALTDMPDAAVRSKTPDVVHPVVRTHPCTGRKCLYVNPGFTVSVVGLEEDESRKMLGELFEHCLQTRFQYRHSWRVGDLVMWDNCSTIHTGTADYGPQHRRLLYRTTVKGGVPF